MLPAPSNPTQLNRLIGSRGGLAPVVARIKRVLGQPVNILLLGESGTGKEVLAHTLHADDPQRRQYPFVPVNCAALPDQLLEAELFGYGKGSFTGADRDRAGLFKRADGGTLFLDEIGDLPLSLQPKLLRVLQQKAIRPLGATRETPIDVRVIAATNIDLKAAIAAGRFRIDLYYRLADYIVRVPPLRQRRQDILPLAGAFVDKYSALFHRPHLKGFTAAAEAWLTNRQWRENNIRELEVIVKHAVLLCDSAAISICHLQAFDSEDPPSDCRPVPDPATLAEALERAGGNISAAARLLGMRRSTFFDWIKRSGLYCPGPGRQSPRPNTEKGS